MVQPLRLAGAFLFGTEEKQAEADFHAAQASSKKGSQAAAAACLTLLSDPKKNKQADFHAAQASSKNGLFAAPKHQHISRRNGRPSGGSGVPNVAFGPEEKQAVLDYIYMYILNIIYIYTF